MKTMLLALRNRRAFDAETGTTTTTTSTAATALTAGTETTTQATGATQATGDAAKPWWEGVVTEEPVVELLKAKNYASPAELAVAYHNLNKTFSAGDKAVVPPAADAPAEQWDAFYKKLGRPDTPDAYEFTLPEGATADPNMMGFGKQLFHAMGLNPTQAQKAVGMWQDFITKDNAARATAWQTENDTAVAALKTEWGADLDANLEAGKRVVKSLNLDAATIGAVEAHMGAAPVVRLLAMIGRASGEGTFKGPSLGGGGSPSDPAHMTKEQAQAEITRLNGDPTFQAKYFDGKHPEHNDAVQRMAALYAKV